MNAATGAAEENKTRNVQTQIHMSYTHCTNTDTRCTHAGRMPRHLAQCNSCHTTVLSEPPSNVQHSCLMLRSQCLVRKWQTRRPCRGATGTWDTVHNTINESFSISDIFKTPASPYCEISLGDNCNSLKSYHPYSFALVDFSPVFSYIIYGTYIYYRYGGDNCFKHI